MKNIKFLALSAYNFILCLLLTLLGCSKDEPMLEYGTPHADFSVKGTIKSKTTSQPVPGVKVTLSNTLNMDKEAISGSTGDYTIKTSDFPKDQTFRIKFTDTDGQANGTFLEKDTVVEFKDPVFKKGDKNWYEGETEKELNIRLTPGNDNQ
jgi:putative lipoprotein (rSAM/lipoprotein system)